MATPHSKAAIGLPQALAPRLEYLGKLLKALPLSITPLNHEEIKSTYCFGLDKDEAEAEGVVYALTQNLKRCFCTHTLTPGAILWF